MNPMLFLSILLVAPSVAEAVTPYNWTWWGGSNVNSGVIWPSAKDDQTNSAHVFGGYSYVGTDYVYSRTNDMWKCDFSRDASSAWTWIHGSNTFNNPGVYTAIGDTNDFVYPGSRDDFMNFYDTEMRKFFLFGGMGYSNSTKRGRLNDRWSYDVDTNRFTWIGGSMAINTAASTAILIDSENITIGSLFAAAFAYDQKSKLFYIFGGENAVDFSNAL
ncbi:hypothetical protein MP638_004356 [Amoeboaphelidium occidentale]|nr:hypothetical protein MP638_004356 [Amoeboaphelidium occidentale]